MSTTTYLQDLILNASFRGISYQITEGWVGWWSASPGAAGTFVSEFSGSGYVRVQATFDAPAGQTTNSNELIWGPATGVWPNIAYVVVCDASTGGHVLAYQSVTDGPTLRVGHYAKIPVGGLVINPS